MGYMHRSVNLGHLGVFMREKLSKLLIFYCLFIWLIFKVNSWFRWCWIPQWACHNICWSACSSLLWWFNNLRSSCHSCRNPRSWSYYPNCCWRSALFPNHWFCKILLWFVQVNYLLIILVCPILILCSFKKKKILTN